MIELSINIKGKVRNKKLRPNRILMKKYRQMSKKDLGLREIK